jgi:hypothetical protein
MDSTLFEQENRIKINDKIKNTCNFIVRLI